MFLVPDVDLARAVLARLASWSVASHAVATDNARTAATACSRSRLEREEVMRFLAARRLPAVVAQVTADGATPARSATH